MVDGAAAPFRKPLEEESLPDAPTPPDQTQALPRLRPPGLQLVQLPGSIDKLHGAILAGYDSVVACMKVREPDRRHAA